MEDPAFRQLVASHEIDCQHEPERFRRDTAAWALAGYAAIWVTLGLSVAGLVLIVQHVGSGRRFAGWTLMLGLICLSMLVSLLRALWTPIAAPSGQRLQRADAPKLFELIDQVRRRAGGPRIDRVLLDGQLNACVVQQPRLGLLGWHRNHLVIGLPLMMCVDKRQFAAVLAHEVGHLSGAHGKLSGWVYRTRRSWMQLAQSRSEARLGSSVADSVLAMFLKHYFPRFNARAFVLGRQQEYEADAAAHRVAGAGPAGQSLVLIGLAARFLDEQFWPGVWRRAQESSRPTGTPYADMLQPLGQVAALPQAPTWLKQAWKALPRSDDTHPSLRQRLEFAGQKAELPPTVARSAAAALLGERLASWCQTFDADWQRDAAESWRTVAGRFSDERRLLEALRAEAQREPLPPDEALRHARCVEALDGKAAGQAALAEAHARHPAHAAIAHALALHGLDSPDAADAPRAHELLLAVGQGESDLAVDALERCIAWLESKDRHAEVKPLREALRQKQAQDQAVVEERMDFGGRQVFESARIGAALLQPALATLRREAAVGAAWLVRKRCHLSPQRAFHVLIVERSKSRPQPDAETYWMALRDRIELPGEWLLIDRAHPHWADEAQAGVLRQMTETAGACVHRGR